VPGAGCRPCGHIRLIDRDGGEPDEMLIAADYPFLDVLWTMIIFFCWVAWIWIAITVFIDIFRRDDISGWGKAAWVVFVIILPFLGVLIYLIAQHDGMRERSARQAQAQKQELDQYVREAAGGSAAEIAKAKELLDSGAITQEEFDKLKAKALS
jgi:ABC-type multidrug transport system fused ATPase/permease subunit